MPAVVAGLAWGGLSSCTRPEEQANKIVFSYWGSTEQQRTERAVIAAFEAANPGVRVESLPVSPPLQRYNDKVQAMLVGQVAPDVIMIEFSRYDEWRSRGVLEDVTAQMAELSRDDELMPIARRAFEREAKFFAVPTNSHAFVTHFNRDALAAAGVVMPETITWAWLEEVAPKLSRRAGSKTATSDYAFQLPIPSMMLWAFGAALFDDPLKPTRSAVNSPAAVEAIGCIRRLLATGAVLPPEIGTMTLDVGTYQLFRDGNLAFFFNGRWSTPDFLNIKNFSWDVRPMPSGPAGNMSQHGGTALGVWTGSKNKELAKRFVQFYASREGMKIVLQGKRLVPVFRGVAFGDEFLALTPPQSLRVFSETMEAGAASNYVYTPGYAEVKRIFEDAMERAMIRPDIPAETILASLEKELNRWIEKNRR